MLLLGRLDGRLRATPYLDIFLARARLDGAAAISGLAGVPTDVTALQDWIAGRTPPPRASEGLNDPISVAAIFHIALTRKEDSRDSIERATLNVLRTMLDDRAEAEAYGDDDLAHFGPLWRRMQAAAEQPIEPASLAGIAHRLFELAALTEAEDSHIAAISTIDGRSLTLPPRARGCNWLLATMLPQLLHNVGLTTRTIPSLIAFPKFLPPSPALLEAAMIPVLRKAAQAGLRDLDRIERLVAAYENCPAVTKRSKAPLLFRLQITYPGLQPKAVARLLGITPQGARKLLARGLGPVRV